jgi:hypothetical protein
VQRDGELDHAEAGAEMAAGHRDGVDGLGAQLVGELAHSGEVIEKTLRPGERLRVHAGHIGMQEPTVQTDIQMVRGFRNVIFGGEGLFLATLTGPGKIWLQSMPIMNLAEEIFRHMPGNETASEGVGGAVATGVAGAAIGGILGGMFGGGSDDS